MKNDKIKYIAVIALAVISIFISIGYAAFSQNLVIKNFMIEVSPENTFATNVKFKANTLSCNKGSGNEEIKSKGILSNDGTTWSNVSIALKSPGDFVSCTVNIENNSSYVAYLKSIIFNNKLQCSPKIGTSTSQSDLVCGDDGIFATVSVGSSSATVNGTTINNVSNIDNNIIGINDDILVNFKVEYPSGARIIDDDIIVTIPAINLIYQSSN